MQEIQLTKGCVALVDDDDYLELSKYKWQCSYYGYAHRAVWNKSRKNNDRLFMHRQILKVTDPNLEVDHINGNKLDNRKENLRICSHQQNVRNMKIPSHNTSGYKGVHWNFKSKKWRVIVHYNSKSLHVGMYSDIIEAAKAYNAKAIELYGEFASLNNIEDENEPTKNR